MKLAVHSKKVDLISFTYFLLVVSSVSFYCYLTDLFIGLIRQKLKTFFLERKMHDLEGLTVKEKEAINELKRRVSNEITNPELKNDPYLYLRFLRARDHNLDLAENMLRNHIAWRIANQIDSILTTYEAEEVVIKYIPLSRFGFDKDGAVVRYFDFGNMDAKGVLKSCKTSAAIKGIVQMFEDDVSAMKKQSEKLGKNFQQWTYILDFDNYSFAKATHKTTLEALVQLFMQYEANYPERLKAVYIINASVYFTLVFAIIKPLLSGNTIQKISIFGKDGWKEILQKNIGTSNLPAFLGGDMTDPDGNPQCNTKVKHGAVVPKEYYMTKSTRRVKNQPGMKKITVSRKSKVPLELDVKEAGSTIEWEFETECRDIGFGLLYKESDNNKDPTVELIPKQRIDTHFSSEMGMFLCEKPGKYILMFDNSYSWIHQKEIYCKAEVIVPKNKEIELND
ncbi:SEC14-like protein 2 [Trichonephila clavata]|uniref:SEC14-like protein 2 n=1 Tax=Trichonephila clavata TaxID=2740835 RepID=A0A8X6IUQ6_TRICU|nr:SEC14-like protein 2 [Trichonephila clavata]